MVPFTFLRSERFLLFFFSFIFFFSCVRVGSKRVHAAARNNTCRSAVAGWSWEGIKHALRPSVRVVVNGPRHGSVFGWYIYIRLRV